MPREQHKIRMMWRESKRKPGGKSRKQIKAVNLATPPQSKDEHGGTEQKKSEKGPIKSF